MPAAKQNFTNVSAEHCGVDDCEGELEEKFKSHYQRQCSRI
jgi:hypothetical protein